MSSRADRFTVVLDANVLAGAWNRNMLLSFAEAGLFRPRWTTDILDETERAIARMLDGDSAAAARQRSRMETAFPEALVFGHEAHLAATALPDANDRHVLAAAIHAQASLVVTENLKDFPAVLLAPFEIEACGLDDFFADIIDLGGPEALGALRRMRARFKNPETTAEQFLRRIEQLGHVATASALAEYVELL